MIKSMEQAKAVQEHRIKNGKRGYAKAVRRFCLRQATDHLGYKELRAMLPVSWVKAAA